MIKKIASIIGKISDVLIPKTIFHYASEDLYKTETHNLKSSEGLLIATRTKIKLLENNSKAGVCLKIKIEHPVEFSVYAKESSSNNYKKIAGKKSVDGKSVIIPEVPLTNRNKFSQGFELLIINDALNNLVEAKITFEKVLYEEVPKVVFVAFVPKEFSIFNLDLLKEKDLTHLALN